MRTQVTNKSINLRAIAFLMGLCAILLISSNSILPLSAQTPISNSRQSSEQLAFNQTFSHHIARVNNTRIHYVIGGKGDPVVLIHGFPTTWHEWRKIMPALAQRYTVIAPDMRGYGDSDKPRSGYDSRTVADDIYKLVSKLGFKRIFLVGHDMGVLPTYSYAAAHPDDVRRLVALEEVLPGFGADELEDQFRLWHWRFQQAPDISEALVADRERTYISWFLRRDSYNKAAFSEADIDEFTRSYSEPGAMRAAFEHYRAFDETTRQNREYAKSKLTMPVLAIGAEALMGKAPEESFRQVATNVRGVIFPQCGHWIPDERPEKLTRELLAFFKDE